MNICITKIRFKKGYQKIKLKRHLFTKAHLNRSVFTLGSEVTTFISKGSIAFKWKQVI